MAKISFIHIEAGDDNWTPTTYELQALVRKFRKAIKEAKPNDTPVIATRNGVRVRVIEYDPAQYVTTGFAATYTNNTNTTPSITPTVIC